MDKNIVNGIANVNNRRFNKVAIIDGDKRFYDFCTDNKDAYKDIKNKTYIGLGYINGESKDELNYFWTYNDRDLRDDNGSILRRDKASNEIGTKENLESCERWLKEKMESDNDYKECIKFLLNHYCKD